MLQFVDVGPRSLANYRGLAPNNLLDDLLSIARDLKGARVVHINATPYGGGVSELLRSAVPILNDLGLIAHWKTISGDQRFFKSQRKSITDFRALRKISRMRIVKPTSPPHAAMPTPLKGTTIL